MPNARTVTDVPRFIFTRIPHTTTALAQIVPKKPITARRPTQRQWNLAPSFQSIQSARTIHTSTPSTSPNSYTYHRPTKRLRRTLLPSSGRKASFSTTATTTTESSPLRYNGVYALSFKPARRAFSATRDLQKSHHFDTLKFVQRLKSEGFNEEQAVAMMRVLNSVIEESIQNLTRTMVLKEDAERSTYTQKVDFAKLRSELANADSSEIQLTRSSHERLASDLAKLSARLRDEIGRTQASVRLDLNLEKGRIREEANSQDMRIKETEARIEQEVASLRERVEAVKFSTLQWLMGVCTGTAALILGAWRLLM